MAPGQVAALESRLQVLSTKKVSQTTAIAEVLRFLSAMTGKADMDKREVLSIIDRLYDQYIAPLDIPGVPDLFEAKIDSLIKNYVISVVDGFLSDMGQVQ